MSEAGQAYIRELREGDGDCRFKCGEHLLDQFFRTHAASNHAVGDCKVYVLEQAEDPKIAGYYTLSCRAFMLTQHEPQNVGVDTFAPALGCMRFQRRSPTSPPPAQ